MEENLANVVRRLADRADIEECLLRYCRGVDRHDRELMLSAYHSDAIDDHGAVVLGASEFVDWAIGYHAEHNELHHHAITNLSIELDGDAAHCESYFTYMGTIPGERTSLAFGRYVDRLEKRSGRWAIAARKCLTESIHEIDVAAVPEEYIALLRGSGLGTRDRTDPSYERPLEVHRPLTATTRRA